MITFLIIYFGTALWFFGFGTAVLHSEFKGQERRVLRSLFASAMNALVWPVVFFIIFTGKVK